MFKKLALTMATLASVFTATLAMSGAAHANDPWEWKYRRHQYNGNMGGPNMPHPGGNNNWRPPGYGYGHPTGGPRWGGGPPPGTFLYDRWRGGGWGGPGFFFGGPLFNDGYYDDQGYWPHRHCRIKKVKRNNHWVSRKVCHPY